MSNQRIDEFLSWRGRLNDPDEAAELGLEDREATWERLMDKVRTTPRKRLYPGLWIAAACLILALVPAVRLFQGRRTLVVTLRPMVPKPVGSPATAMAMAMAGAGAAAMPAAVTTTTAQNMTTAIARTTQHYSMKTPVPSRLREAPVVLAEISSPPGPLTVTTPDTVMKTLNVTRLRTKQLKVVHINELEGSAFPAPAVTATDTRRHFGIYLQPSLNRTALPSPPPAADPAILKVKLSSPN